ncbi:aKG-HExxH-type peptide beta-hydroxylase [Nocardiopsis metallicus]|uniref:HEXXH motif domain-containing protein n=1 Tax=Nocardiopsis metallicus TaxID=179819 RepID=A0A840W3J7_9ACTN|nr:HEXXH motif-containing putative peptide modification protein [Nocardiopsis metallicus]MBB5491480.1 hypothetical protein [Nocardiopsis metallicus]
MRTPLTTFSLTPIPSLHQRRTQQIRTLLQTDATAQDHTAVDYCLAHHALEGAESAARSHDATALDWYRTHPGTNAAQLSIPTPVGPRVVISPNLEDLPRSAISETPYYVLGPTTQPAPPDLRELAADAYAAGARFGFADLLANHAVTLCLLRHKQLGQTLDSWTITRLPGTVFCDHVGEPTVLARDLVHEAGHNWLNDALVATNCKLSDEVTFYSPWKDQQRPVFGFVHACWAFPLTMIYTARALPHTSGALHRFLTSYLDQQRPLLAATTSDHPRALELITHPELRERLRTIHNEALSL